MGLSDVAAAALVVALLLQGQFMGKGTVYVAAEGEGSSPISEILPDFHQAAFCSSIVIYHDLHRNSVMTSKQPTISSFQ